MITLTLKIPQSLNDALQLSSARRQMSKSAVVREALEKTLEADLHQASPSAQWVKKWSGAIGNSKDASIADTPGDDRLAHLLKKHVH